MNWLLVTCRPTWNNIWWAHSESMVLYWIFFSFPRVYSVYNSLEHKENQLDTLAWSTQLHTRCSNLDFDINLWLLACSCTLKLESRSQTNNKSTNNAEPMNSWEVIYLLWVRKPPTLHTQSSIVHPHLHAAPSFQLPAVADLSFSNRHGCVVAGCQRRQESQCVRA